MSYTIYGPPRPDGTQEVSTFDGDPPLRIERVPVNAPQGGFRTQDHMLSYELPADPKYDLPGAPDPVSGAFPTTSEPLTPAQEADKLRADLAAYRRNVSALVDRGEDSGARSRQRNAFYRTEERPASGMLYETPGLGIDIWQAIVTGVQESAREAFKGAKVSAPNLKLPAVGLNLPKINLPIPDALKGISVKLPNIGLVAKSVSQKLEEQRRAEAAARQAPAAQPMVERGTFLPPTTGQTLFLYGALGLAAGLAVRALVSSGQRRRRAA